MRKTYLRTTKNLYSCTDNGITVFYSYQTPVAIQDENNILYVSQNYWSVSTGRHLTWIDGGSTEAKNKRLKNDVFEKLKERHGVERSYSYQSSFINPRQNLKTVEEVLNYDASLPEDKQLLKI